MFDPSATQTNRTTQMATKLNTTNQMVREFARVLAPRVQVQDASGKVLGDVAANATSIGASKIAGRSCYFAQRAGKWVWVAK
jgi:hypothetical protein